MGDGNGGQKPRGLALFSGLHLTLAARLKAYLFTGILVTAPISITLYLAWLVVDGVDRLVDNLLPAAFHPDQLLPFTLPGLGLLLLLAFLILVGMVSAGMVGSLLVRLGEAIVGRMPVLRGIHTAIKQVFETVLAQKSDAFREVVLVEFPRKDAWSIAFVSGTTRGEVARVLEQGGEMINVFVPTTPNPTSGYLIFVPRASVKPLSMSVEDGLKLVVSGGLVAPGE
ncbi:DUF502 domain-containing protein [Niveispirillum sp.]|uniref:DUF502 domain-containing protein n=1 Tax=Niveispirillum sp. TaxID=1917217 RepID=UPI001B68078F|nr:DUF502 domain-containing protein [Niveispirillum sp.]MBP7339943.1 DUF502 domain-containing protein [Niveispirillum sp.]